MIAASRLARLPQSNSLLLLSLLLVILPHLPHVPVWLALASLAVLGWRLLHDLGMVSLPGRLVRIALVLGGIMALLFSYHTVVGREPGTALLLLMLTLKLFEMQSWRDVTVVVFLAFFVMVTAYLFSQSLLMGSYTLLVVLLLIASMISFQHPQQVLARQSLRRDLSLASRLLIQALPVALILFVLFPRIPGPLWGLPEDARSGYTGLSDRMEPGRISRLAESNEVAFRVQFEGVPPAPENRYWRGPIMWRYDGRQWEASTDPIRPVYDFDLRTYGEAVKYQITLEPHGRRWLFALEMPVSSPQRGELSSEYQMRARDRINELFRYTLTSYPDYRLEPDGLPGRERYLMLPAETAPQARKLVEQLRRQNHDDEALVGAVLNYFEQQPFYYTREPPLLFDDPVDEFLFETRRGYCEHYASAFTVMMRQAGIPARVVTGYYGGQINPLDDYMIVSQASAHAWSEVWLQDRGWVRIDPTAAIPPSRVESSEDLARRRPALREQLDARRNWWQRSLRQAVFAWDALNNRWQQWVIGYNSSQQNALLRALGLEKVGWKGLVMLLITTMVVALLIVAAILFLRRPAMNNRLDRLYRRFLRKLAQKGINKRPAETPSAFGQRAAEQEPEVAEHIEHVTRLYLHLRYARLSVTQEQAQLKQLAREVRRFSV